MAPQDVGFGARLTTARDAAGLTQAELASRLGKPHTRVSEWEAGAVPRPTTLQQLAAVLGCSVDWLLSGERFVDLVGYRGFDTPTGAPVGSATQAERIDAFIFEVGGMAGALPEDAAFARRQALSFIEHIMSAAGTVDEDLGVFLDVNLRKQIERRIDARKKAKKK